MMFNNKWFRFWKVIPKNNKIFFSNNKKSEAHESIVNSSEIFFEWKELMFNDENIVNNSLFLDEFIVMSNLRNLISRKVGFIIIDERDYYERGYR